jgi:hypothetical protein
MQTKHLYIALSACNGSLAHISMALLLLQGCTALSVGGVNVYCPASAPYFVADATGRLETAANDFCSEAAPLSCDANRVPVRNSVTAGTAGGIIGCLDVPEISAASGCPSPVPAAGTYIFPVVFGVDTGSVNAGNIGECIKGSSCGTLVPFKATSTSTTVLGCIAGVNAGFCPSTANTFLGTGYPIALYSQTTSTDATAKTVACIPTINDCSAAAAAGYPVPVGDGPLNGVLGTLRGCLADNTACPLSGSATDDRYPLINSAKKITSCRAVSDCAATDVPICDVRANGQTIANDFKCSDTKGCLAATAATPYTICSQLSSTSTLQRYPSAVGVASQYKFSAKLSGATYLIAGCGIYATTATACAYPAGGTVINAALPQGNSSQCYIFCG